MAISTLIKGRAPYKNVLVNDLILDKDGKKMSKSRGNTVDPFKLLKSTEPMRRDGICCQYRRLGRRRSLTRMGS